MRRPDGPQAVALVLFTGAVLLVLALSFVLSCTETRAECLVPPFWTDPELTDECTRLSLDCACSGLTWDPSERAEWYEIERETISTGARITVGTVHGTENEDGTRNAPSTFWTVFLDSSFPHSTTPYRYRVRACNAAGCSANSNAAATRGWTVAACFDSSFGTVDEVPCYVGASCKIPPPMGCQP